MVDSSRLLSGAGDILDSPRSMVPIVSGSAGRERYRQSPQFVSKTRAGRMSSAPRIAPLDSECGDGDADLDFATAEEVCAATEAGRLTIATEPIYNINNPDLVLYQECFPRLRGSRGEFLFPETFIPSLERTGMIRWFDRYVVRRVIRALRDQPDLVLGINISALSAVDDALWTSVLIDLQQSLDVAQRLVLEISENAPLKIGRARRFGNMLRQLGCVVAIDDFGVGYGVETSIAIGRPDIIKIDASFLSRIGTDTNNRSRLAGMIRIASDMSSKVIVEGVENEADIDRIRGAGAIWAQGRRFERQCSCLV